MTETGGHVVAKADLEYDVARGILTFSTVATVDEKEEVPSHAAHAFGEKSAGRAWCAYLDRFLRKRFGAIPIVADRCVYQIKIGAHYLNVGVIVGDVSFNGNSQYPTETLFKIQNSSPPHPLGE